MSEFYSFEGIRDHGTYVVDSSTTSTIKDNPNDIVGKVVAITGKGEVGYASSGKKPKGYVLQVEPENVNSDKFVVSVWWNVSHEGVPYSGSVNAGDYVACDGDGNVSTSTTYLGAEVWDVDDETNTCTVYFAG